MSRLDGWQNWERAFFNRLFFGSDEIVFNLPARISFPKEVTGAVKRNLAGTHLHQSFWLGQDAPINLSPIESFEIDFQHDSMNEYMKILSLGELCAFEPQDFCPLIWIPDKWYIPAGGAGRTTWKLSRSTPYDLININYLDDYKPIADVDGTLLTLITSGTPGAGEFLIPQSVESDTLTTDDLTGGSILTLWYPAKFLVCGVNVSQEIPDDNVFEMGLSMKEFLPTRQYEFSIP